MSTKQKSSKPKKVAAKKAPVKKAPAKKLATAKSVPVKAESDVVESEAKGESAGDSENEDGPRGRRRRRHHHMRRLDGCVAVRRWPGAGLVDGRHRRDDAAGRAGRDAQQLRRAEDRKSVV